MIFEQSWRWYGPQDSVSLEAIKQAGASGVVTSLHHIPIGEVWRGEEIKKRISLLEESNKKFPFQLNWNVVESLPVHEAIKQGKPERDKLIENYCKSLVNLAENGIRTICYNFMPVLDWLRTNVKYELEDGSTALQHDRVDLIIFDVYLLERGGAEKDYPKEMFLEAKKRFKKMDQSTLTNLKESLLMALPGDEKGFTIDKLRRGINDYKDINDEELRNNLIYFLKKVIPVARKYEVNLAIHPDDPPWPILGLPRVVSKFEHLEYIFKEVQATNNGLTFCSGSLGASDENDLSMIIKRFYKRIHFVHLRSVERDKSGLFYEANHLEGSAEMFELVKTFYDCKRQFDGKILPMRPDHGHQMLDDLDKITYPGYSAIGRLRGLAELRGLELGIVKSND